MPFLPTGVDVDRSEPGVAIVALRGEHESYTAPKVDAVLDDLLAEGMALVLDLTETTFVDSSVVAVLLRVRTEAHEVGRRFALVMDDSTGWAVRSLFEITGLERVFPIAASREAALDVVRTA